MNKYKNTASLPTEGFVRLNQILSVIPVSATTWWNGVAKGQFPSSIKLTARTTVWRVEDIRSFIEEASAGVMA